MGSIHFVDTGFQPTITNPFNNNQTYDQEWILLKLLDDAAFYSFTGKGSGTLFQVIITKKIPYWTNSILDFLEYETSHDKNIIVAVSEEDLDIAREAYEGHHFMDHFLREYEEQVLVHSTTWDGWQSIKKDGCLKSWNNLKLSNSIEENKPIGGVLGDPINYSNYIMFTNGGVTGEIVVSSKQKGHIDMNIDARYKPGARLYFDAEKIAQDGLLVRDGVHLKVKDTLPLEKYLIWAATSETIGLQKEEATPNIFSTKCDKLFQDMFNYKLG